MLLSYFKEIKEKRVLITFHSLADVDAVGSAFALRSWFPNAMIVAPDGQINSHAKRLLNALQLKMDEFKPGYDAMIVLDTHSKDLLGRFAAEKADIVIDHHIKQDSIDAQHAIIDNGYCSTCEIVYEILKELGPVDGKTAACLLAGIISDSANFRSANRRTFRYVFELMGLSEMDYQSMLALIESRLDTPQRIAILKAIQECVLERVSEFLLVKSHASTCESRAAEALIDIGADVSFVGYSGEDARISARMRIGLEGKLNLAEIMADVGKMLGGSGGGHEMAAGANGPDKEVLEDALAECIALTKHKLGR
ncbi:MAG: DHH family phosphoesterase [Candidatus Micrarchaeota archaeon]